MVALTWALIALCLGLLTFILIPLLSQSLSMAIQMRIGRWCYKSAMRTYGQAAIAWRSLGGPELKPLHVNDEENIARVVLSSGRLGDDKELPFENYDDRIHRLHGKPLAIVPETAPVAVDAELSEMGHWFNEKGKRDGFSYDDGVVEPYLSISDQLHAAHPLDVLHLAAFDVAPENIQTAKEMTKARFAKYGRRVGAMETLATLMAFAVGAGAVGVLVYIRDELLGGAGDIGTTVPISLAPKLLDLAVRGLGVTPL